MLYRQWREPGFEFRILAHFLSITLASKSYLAKVTVEVVCVCVCGHSYRKLWEGSPGDQVTNLAWENWGRLYSFPHSFFLRSWGDKKWLLGLRIKRWKQALPTCFYVWGDDSQRGISCKSHSRLLVENLDQDIWAKDPDLAIQRVSQSNDSLLLACTKMELPNEPEPNFFLFAFDVEFHVAQSGLEFTV